MEKTTYYVYRHVCPDGAIYIGVTTDTKRRWQPSLYKGKALEPWIAFFAWENIEHEVIYTCDDRKEALEIEDEMIQYWADKGVCINKRRSGLIRVSDVKGYSKAYHNDHREEHNAQMRAWYDNHREEQKAYINAFHSTPEGKIYNRVKAYNQYHPDNITITPMQAKLNYIQYNIVPSFIKHDDIDAIVQTSTTDQLPLFNEDVITIDSSLYDSSFFNSELHIETEQNHLF